MKQIEKTLTSLEVVEMVDREHRSVIRDIRNIINHLGGQHKAVPTYFQESEYTDTQGRKQFCFLLTKKGCELYATRMIGAKGTKFAAAYIERFNEMENTLKEQSNTKLLLKAALEHEEKIETIQTDVNMLKNSMRIDGAQEHQLRTLGKQKVMKALGGYKSTAYKELSTKLFSRFWRDFNNHFMLPRYSELPKSKFEEAKNYIDVWRPDTSTQIEINIYNSQLLLGGVN